MSEHIYPVAFNDQPPADWMLWPEPFKKEVRRVLQRRSAQAGHDLKVQRTNVWFNAEGGFWVGEVVAA